MYGSPKEIDSHTQRLLSILKTGTDPVVMTIAPEQGATEGDCFFNVEDKVKKDGGSRCLGWAILQGGGILEAEAHAVWRNPQGQLLDITPREPRFVSKTIMFVEDPAMVFQGRLIDNRRLNITNSPLVDHIIKIEETIVAIQIPCTKVYRGRQIQPEAINRVVSTLRKEINNIVEFANRGGQLKSPCFCGGGSIYLNCHGRVEEGMQGVLEAVRQGLANYPTGGI